MLVVDDEDDLRLLVRLRLESHRTDRSIEVVGEARDGVEALDVFDALVCSRPPDVVILDHHMPGLTGTEVAERMLSVAPTQRIVLFSADLTPDLIEQARAIGIRRCVGKEAINALAEIVLDVDGRT